MEQAELNKLEANIKRAIELIHKLLIENQRLRQENQGLLRRIHENERIIQEHENQDHFDGDLKDQLDIHREQEGKIKQKIQQMLEKLEAFKQVSIAD